MDSAKRSIRELGEALKAAVRDSMTCPACGSAETSMQGVLDMRAYFRCRACGLDYGFFAKHNGGAEGDGDDRQRS